MPRIVYEWLFFFCYIKDLHTDISIGQVFLDSLPKIKLLEDSSMKRLLLIVLQAKRAQRCVETFDVLEISHAKFKPVVVTTKWETFDPPQQQRNGDFITKHSPQLCSALSFI